MAVEGGEELSLLSRSISAFSQFLPVLNLLALQYKSTNTDANAATSTSGFANVLGASVGSAWSMDLQVLSLLALLVQKYKY